MLARTGDNFLFCPFDLLKPNGLITPPPPPQTNAWYVADNKTVKQY